MEEQIIKNCAPVLGGLKAGSLFNCRINEEELRPKIYALNKKMFKYGIFIFILKTTPDYSLIYVCRKTKLLQILDNMAVQNFLKYMGYEDLSFYNTINTLKTRLTHSLSFPHEIGVFLNYPIEDVVDFIENKGANFKLCGIWKVYNDELYAKKLFYRFNKCTEVYINLFKNHSKTIEDLTVTA